MRERQSVGTDMPVLMIDVDVLGIGSITGELVSG
jgi:hypothetical protein